VVVNAEGQTVLTSDGRREIEGYGNAVKAAEQVK
jgi:hypothetical protein